MKRKGFGWLYGFCALANLAMIAVALHKWGAAEIRADAGEVVFLTIAGTIWLGVCAGLFSWLGVSFRDDVVERKNVAALAALCGAVTAMALIYAGGSVGEGPSYMNNAFTAGLGAGVLLVLWILLELGAKVSISITEERNAASGLRLGGFLLASGLVLGRAGAGDWHSEEATMRDLVHDGWPVVVLLVIALAIERFARPTRERPLPSWPVCGLLPAAIYVALASAWVSHLGAWEGMPK